MPIGNSLTRRHLPLALLVVHLAYHWLCTRKPWICRNNPIILHKMDDDFELIFQVIQNSSECDWHPSAGKRFRGALVDRVRLPAARGLGKCFGLYKNHVKDRDLQNHGETQSFAKLIKNMEICNQNLMETHCVFFAKLQENMIICKMMIISDFSTHQKSDEKSK